MTTEIDTTSLIERLRACIGPASRPAIARDPVNQPMIRHWCDAMSDETPVYLDADYAAGSVHAGIVAPPAMLYAWTMPGNTEVAADPDDPQSRALSMLDRAGYTSVVATNCTQEYPRYLKLGETLSASHRVTDVSDEKHTALGRGVFVSTLTEFRNQDGEIAGTMKFRLLKFMPGTGRGAAEAAPERGLRPRPGISRDTKFFWEGLEAGELRIQCCRSCAALHHPPLVRCPDCGSYEFGYQVSTGRGSVYSFVEPCYPKLPSFDYPYVVALVELEEGTRLISNLVDIDADKARIGMPVELVIRRPDPELALPMFRPRRPERRSETLAFDSVAVGEELAPCPVPITAKLIVAGAIASRDYQDVHHDRELAIKRGSPDIFMNILTTGGLCARYVSDWAGPQAILRKLDIRLGAPNYPHDTMTLSGSVVAKTEREKRCAAAAGADAATAGPRAGSVDKASAATGNGDDASGCGSGAPGVTGKAGGLIELSLRGYNSLGDHVTGSVTVELPTRGPQR